MQKNYYYRFKGGMWWLLFNILLLALILKCAFFCPIVFVYPQMFVFVGLTAISFFLWMYKYLMKHQMAAVDEETITIDHCQPLKWSDISKAEERIIRCCGKKRIIVLLPKAGIDYKYNFLQRHNLDFTAFSIPLYGILSPEDEAELIKLVGKKVKLQRLKK